MRVRAVAGSSEEYTLRYYWCQPGAQVFPAVNVFLSQMWEGDDELQGTGPVSREWQWDRGHNLGWPGRCYQGAPDWFTTGIPAEVLGGPLPTMICRDRFLQSGGGAVCDGVRLQIIEASGGALGNSGLIPVLDGDAEVLGDGSATLDGPPLREPF